MSCSAAEYNDLILGKHLDNMLEKSMVFLSYARKDTQVVQELHDFLVTYGFRPLMPGSSQSHRLDGGNLTKRAIEDSDFFIACFSSNSVLDSHVRKEFKKALEVTQRVPEGHFFSLSIRLDQCEIPEPFQNNVSFDWFNDDERSKLLRFLTSNSSIMQVNLKLDIEYDLSKHPPRSYISIVKFTPEGKHIVAGLRQDKVAIWDTVAGNLKIDVPRKSTRLSGNLDWPTYSVAISPNGKFLATTTYEQEIQIWEFSDLKPYRLLETFNHRATTVDFSPNGEWLIAGLDNDGEIWSWSIVDDFRRADHVKGHNGRVEKVKFHPTTTAFASCSIDGNIRYWKIMDEEIREIRSYSRENREHIVDVAFSSDGLLLASGSVSGQICLWDIETGHLVQEYKHDDVVRTLAISPDGGLLVSGSNDRTLKIWNTGDGRTLISKKFERPVSTLDFSPDGQSFAMATAASTKIQIWRIEKG